MTTLSDDMQQVKEQLDSVEKGLHDQADSHFSSND